MHAMARAQESPRLSLKVRSSVQCCHFWGHKQSLAAIREAFLRFVTHTGDK